MNIIHYADKIRVEVDGQSMAISHFQMDNLVQEWLKSQGEDVKDYLCDDCERLEKFEAAEELLGDVEEGLEELLSDMDCGTLLDNNSDREGGRNV